MMWLWPTDAVPAAGSKSRAAAPFPSPAIQVVAIGIVALGGALVVTATIPESYSVFLRNLWTVCCSFEHLSVALAASLWVVRTLQQTWSHALPCTTLSPVGAATAASVGNSRSRNSSEQHALPPPVKQQEQRQAACPASDYIRACRVSSPNLQALQDQPSQWLRRSQSFHIKWSGTHVEDQGLDEDEGRYLDNPKITGASNFTEAAGSSSATATRRRTRSYSQSYKSEGRAQVLCLDDDPLNQHVIQALLAADNYNVLCMETGEEVLEHLKSCEALPDIILCDITLPGMNGFEVCKAIREQFTGCELPIIMLTGRTGEEDVARGLELGANDYMTKPVRCIELKARIATQLALTKSAALVQEASLSVNLLHAILPAGIIDKLRRGSALVAESHAQVTILFSDIKDFTTMAAEFPTERVILLLNEMFTAFDHLCDDHGVYKVETIGDAYMIVSGHDGRADHAVRMMRMASDMLKAVSKMSRWDTARPVRIRIGVHTGPAHAGVVGFMRPHYAFFGDTVNTASRMESTGFPMAVQVSHATMMAVLQQQQSVRGNPCTFVDCGLRPIKGKGSMHTHLLKVGEWRDALECVKANTAKEDTSHLAHCLYATGCDSVANSLLNSATSGILSPMERASTELSVFPPSMKTRMSKRGSSVMAGTGQGGAGSRGSVEQHAVADSVHRAILTICAAEHDDAGLTAGHGTAQPRNIAPSDVAELLACVSELSLTRLPADNPSAQTGTAHRMAAGTGNPLFDVNPRVTFACSDGASRHDALVAGAAVVHPTEQLGDVQFPDAPTWPEPRVSHVHTTDGMPRRHFSLRDLAVNHAEAVVVTQGTVHLPAPCNVVVDLPVCERSPASRTAPSSLSQDLPVPTPGGTATFFQQPVDVKAGSVVTTAQSAVDKRSSQQQPARRRPHSMPSACPVDGKVPQRGAGAARPEQELLAMLADLQKLA